MSNYLRITVVYFELIEAITNPVYMFNERNIDKRKVGDRVVLLHVLIDLV